MTIIPYINNSDKIVLNKDIEHINNLLSMNGVLKAETSITNPVIRVSVDLAQYPDFIQTNYLKIEEFNRFYYVTDIVSLSYNMWELKCEVDVLMTYQDNIKELNALVERQQHLFNLYLKDPMLQVDNKSEITTLKLIPPTGHYNEFDIEMLLLVSQCDELTSTFPH